MSPSKRDGRTTDDADVDMAASVFSFVLQSGVRCLTIVLSGSSPVLLFQLFCAPMSLSLPWSMLTTMAAWLSSVFIENASEAAAGASSDVPVA